MNVAAPQTPCLKFAYRAYVVLFFLYLAAPLVAASVFAFNDSMFPALPWNGFTVDWFFGDVEPKLGMFHDRRLLRGMQNSLLIGLVVATLSITVGTCNARSEEHTSELQSLMRISYAVFCLKKKTYNHMIAKTH